LKKNYSRYKSGDIVLVKSPAGDCIPNIHVKLLKRIIVKETKGRQVGIRKTMDWPEYSGWEATPVFKEECDILRKEWSIPFTNPGNDITFVYDSNIIKKPRNPKIKETVDNKNKKRQKRRYVRKK
tara:strand:- start:43 stop:417 length:375 start_codon:yes stop_codon:yes gene_type:complete